MNRAVHPLVYPGVAILSGAALALEVVLTRILSLMVWHHFTYVVIGVALLGFGAAGSILAGRRLRGIEERHPPTRRLAAQTLGFALLIPLCYIAMTRVAIAPNELLSDPLNQGVALLLLYGLIALPFLAVGFAICTALSSWPERVGAIYFADLLGGGLGVAAAVLFMEELGAPGMVAAAGAAAALAAGLFASADLLAGRSRRGGFLAVTSAGAAAALLLAILPQARDGRLDPPLAPDKELAIAARVGIEVEESRWNPLARIDVTHEVDTVPKMGGAFGPQTPRMPMHLISQDGTAPTSFIKGGSEPRELQWLGTASAGSGYIALAARGIADVESLVIGVGGGVDLLIALHFGVQRVTGAEINSSTVALLSERYAEYTGELVARPEVELVNAEGRHFASTAGRQFDLIQLSGVDTYSALSSGAQVLSESYLYTREAIHCFLDALDPRGILSYSRIAFPDQPRETLRLVAAIAEALEARGVARPAEHIFILRAGAWAAVLVSPTAFEEATLDALVRHTQDNGYVLTFDPRHPRPTAFDDCLRATPEQREGFYAGYPFRVDPATDDQPFFFNYFKWRSVLETQDYGGHPYLTPFPTGMALLLVGLLQTVLLAAVFILRPVWGLGAQGGRRSCRLAAFAYFAALGVGFIGLEIVLMQRLVLFLGHPTWSLVMVLATMLIAAGLGSLTVGPRTAPRRRLKLLLVLIPAAIIGGWLLTDLAIESALHLGFAWRALITAGLLTIPSFAMGMAFPTGIRMLADVRAELIPWAWAINGFTTVFGATATVLLAMEFGFSTIAWGVAPLYFLGILAMLLGVRPAAGGEGSG